MNRNKLIFLILTIVCGFCIWEWGNTVFIFFESSQPSRSFGSPAHGSLQNGKRLPTRGKNFQAYSNLGALLGRNSVQDRVRTLILDCYDQLNQILPDVHFVYGETGWPQGGPFPPHKTHQNGLSVDFFVPVRDQNRKSVPYPAAIWNKFGYGLEFDSDGKSGAYQIDFEAIAQHLQRLQATASKYGLSIDVVIFDNALQNHLFKTPTGQTIRTIIPFSKSQPWVRHDEHYHVNFRLAGK